jgi:zinc transport system ATP-binding protein
VPFRALVGAIPYEGEIRWAVGATVGYVPQKLDIERDLPIIGSDFLRRDRVSAGRRPPTSVGRWTWSISRMTW